MKIKESAGTNKTDPRLLMLSPDDNVVVLRSAIGGGEQIFLDGATITISEHISLGHKLARNTISPGDKILKYGAPIGSATSEINIGNHVHVHNMKSDYTPTYIIENKE